MGTRLWTEFMVINIVYSKVRPSRFFGDFARDYGEIKELHLLTENFCCCQPSKVLNNLLSNAVKVSQIV